MRIGVLGGSFNPVHMGHIMTARNAAAILHLERVYFVVAANPPHKEPESLLNAETRLMMVELACQEDPLFFPSRMELDREGVSYTIDTVREIVRQFGHDVHFITGQDAMEDIASWKSALSLLKMVNFAVAAREGYDQSALAEFIQSALCVRYCNVKFKDMGAGREGLVKTIGVAGSSTVINILRTPQAPVSSSEVRRKLKVGESVKYLVPGSVERYLNENNLYRKD